MRPSLLNLIKQTIIFEYKLPNNEKNIPKVDVSTNPDLCYSVSVEDVESIKNIIYNSIIEYSFNEFELKLSDFQNLHSRALRAKINYNESAKQDTKIKYGFFGEVLLYSILHVILGIKPLIARGYFYNPLENSETKGYDSYHLIEKDGDVELWFGEVKFHKNYKNGINDIFGKENKEKGLNAGWKIENALSDGYLDRNILAIIENHKNNLNIKDAKVINKIVLDWEANSNIIISEQLKKYNAKLVYPVLVLYEGKSDYDESIKQIPKYINETYKNISAKLVVDYSIFFIFLPLQNVREIKLDVISWIESKKELMQ